MKMNDIPFGTTDWSTIEPTEHAGDEGTAYWRTRQFGAIRVRMARLVGAPRGGAFLRHQRSFGEHECTAFAGHQMFEHGPHRPDHGTQRLIARRAGRGTGVHVCKIERGRFQPCLLRRHAGGAHFSHCERVHV